MSDPVTNVEIEDVLTSIRRLVSDNEWARPKVYRPDSAEDARRMEKAPKFAEKPTAERFVLTPSLRIAESAEPAVSAVENVEVEEDEEVSITYSEPYAEPEASVVEEAPEQEPQFQTTRLMPKDAVEFSSDYTEDSDTMAADARMNELERMMEELEAAVNHGSEWDDEAPFEHVADSSADRPMRESDTVEDAEVAYDAPELGVLETAIEDAIFDAIQTAPKQPEPEVQTLFEAEEPVVEEPAATQDHYMPPQPDEEFAIPEEDAYEHNDDPDLDLDADPLEDFYDTGPQFEEAALREMVRDIIREELQGKLGERITRNVRKLVRREIYRVMAQQDYE